MAEGSAKDTTKSGTVEQVQFDDTFLRAQNGEAINVNRFTRGNAVSPGKYVVEIVVNGSRIAREDVRFVANKGEIAARPCLSRALLQRAGVDLGKADAAAGRGNTAAAADAELCGDIGSIIPGATVDFDFEEQRLEVSVPQAYMRNSARGYVSPDQWEQGVNAGFLSYNANTFRTGGSGLDSTQSYLGLNAGVNIGAWHLRHQSSVTAATGQSTQFDNIATYVQRDVEAARAGDAGRFLHDGRSLRQRFLPWCPDRNRRPHAARIAARLRAGRARHRRVERPRDGAPKRAGICSKPTYRPVRSKSTTSIRPVTAAIWSSP